jgi:DNA primase
LLFWFEDIEPIMGLIPEEIIARVIDHSDIVETIGAYVPLKRAGRNFKGNCPFHNEKTPSFVVNPDKQIFHCFGCDAGGNVIGFVMKHDVLTFPEAVRLLAKKVNIVVPESNGDGSPKNNIRQQILIVNALTAQFFRKNLLSDQGSAAEKARAYLKKRHIDLATAERFQLGFAQDRWDSLIEHLRSKKISLSLMEKAGLIVPRENGQGYYDRFRNRIIFPIFDTQAHCRAFGARSLGSAGGADTISAKYINSPETPLYVKGQHLYGFDLAKQSVSRNDSVIIVEGYMDCIMPSQDGVLNIVASLGTALTVEQIRLLRRYTRNVVMLFDMDPAGESAILRSLDTLTVEGMNVHIARLAKGHDPDSFIREFGVDAFREKIKKAQPLFEYKLNTLMSREDATAIESKAKISGEMLQTIEKFDNAILQTEYIKRLAQSLSVSEQALVAELKKVRQMTGEKKTYGKRVALQTAVQEQIRVVESDILKLLIEEQSFIEVTKKEIAPSDFRDDQIREAISKIYDLFEQGKEINSVNLINSFEDPDMQHLIARVMAKETVCIGDKRKIHSDYMNRMKKDRIKWKMKGLQQKISEVEKERNFTQLESLLKEYNQLVKEVSL